jgi:hypothetical protein
MAGRGGPNGGGRPKGSISKRKQALTIEAIERGITPLEVMLDNMRFYVNEGNRDKASLIAKDAAPYIHPRLTTVDVGNKDGVSFKGEQTVIILPPNARD